MGQAVLPAAAAGMTMVAGLDPFSLGMRAVMGPGKLAFGAAALGSLGVGYAAGKVLDYGMGQIATGAAREARLGTFLGSQFGFRGGQMRGMGGGEVEQVSKAIYDLGNDLNRSVSEITRNLTTMKSLGLTRKVRDVQEFKTTMRETMKALDTISDTFNVSMQEAGRFLEGMRGAGFRDTRSQMAMLTPLRQAQWATGMTRTQVTAHMQAGTGLARMVGATGWRGAVGAQRALVGVGAAENAGIVTEAMLEEATGLQGQEAVGAFAQIAQRALAQRVSTPYGRFFLAAGARDDMRRLDMDRMRAVLGGGYSMSDIKRLARGQVYGKGRKGMDRRFLMYEEEMRGQALQMGPQMLAGMVRAEMGERLYDTEDPRVNKMVRQAYGLSKRQAEAVLNMARKLPEMMAEELRQEESRIRHQTGGRAAPEGLAALKSSVATWVRKTINEPLQEYGAEVHRSVTAMMSSAERAVFGGESRAPRFVMSKAASAVAARMAMGGLPGVTQGLSNTLLKGGFDPYAAENAGNYEEGFGTRMKYFGRDLLASMKVGLWSGNPLGFAASVIGGIAKGGRGRIAGAAIPLIDAMQEQLDQRSPAMRAYQELMRGSAGGGWRQGGFLAATDAENAMREEGLVDEARKWMISGAGARTARLAWGGLNIFSAEARGAEMGRAAAASGGKLGAFFKGAKTDLEFATRYAMLVPATGMGGSYSAAGLGGGGSVSSAYLAQVSNKAYGEMAAAMGFESGRIMDDAGARKRMAEYISEGYSVPEAISKAEKDKKGSALGAAELKGLMTHEAYGPMILEALAGTEEGKARAMMGLQQLGQAGLGGRAAAIRKVTRYMEEGGTEGRERLLRLAQAELVAKPMLERQQITRSRMARIRFGADEMRELRKAGLWDSMDVMIRGYTGEEPLTGEARMGAMSDFLTRYASMDEKARRRAQEIVGKQGSAGAEFGIAMGYMNEVVRSMGKGKLDDVVKGRELNKTLTTLLNTKVDLSPDMLKRMSTMSKEDLQKTLGAGVAPELVQELYESRGGGWTKRELGKVAAVRGRALASATGAGAAGLTATAAEAISSELGEAGKGFGTGAGMHNEMRRQSGILLDIARNTAAIVDKAGGVGATGGRFAGKQSKGEKQENRIERLK